MLAVALALVDAVAERDVAGMRSTLEAARCRRRGSQWGNENEWDECREAHLLMISERCRPNLKGDAK